MYEKSVRLLMPEMLDELGVPGGQVISREQAIQWFADRYPKIKQGTITAHLIRFSTNAPSRLHYNVRPDGEDLLFQIDGSHFRRYDPAKDPLPIHEVSQVTHEPVLVPDDEEYVGANEFAYETDLRNFLAKNLSILERGLPLYEEEEITGIEFPAGARRIDILALSPEKEYVVIELKVSRGYDRVVGQLLRHMALDRPESRRLVAESERHYRRARNYYGFKIGLLIPIVQLYEYELSVSSTKISI
jgi:hypothetical protein